MTSLDNETAADGRTNEQTAKNYRTYRDHPLRGDLKNISEGGLVIFKFHNRLINRIFTCWLYEEALR